MVNVRNVKIKFAEELNSRMLERGVTYRQAALAVGNLLCILLQQRIGVLARLLFFLHFRIEAPCIFNSKLR